MVDIPPSVAELLQEVAWAVRRAAKDTYASLGVTMAQMRTLRTLDRIGEPVRMGDLADRLHIVPRSATSVVDDLEAAGLVARHVDPADRRASLVGLTDAGRRLLDDARQLRAAANEQFVARLSVKDQADLRRLLTQLTDPPS